MTRSLLWRFKLIGTQTKAKDPIVIAKYVSEKNQIDYYVIGYKCVESEGRYYHVFCGFQVGRLDEDGNKIPDSGWGWFSFDGYVRREAEEDEFKRVPCPFWFGRARMSRVCPKAFEYERKFED